MRPGSPANWVRGVSLADKCLILFGAAILLIVGVALAVPWVRMRALAWEVEVAHSRALAEAWSRTGADVRNAVLDPGTESWVIEDGADWPEGAPRALVAGLPGEGGERGEVAALDRAAEPARIWYARALGGPDSEANGRWLVLARPTDAPVRASIDVLYLLSSGSLVLGLAVLVFYLITHRLVLSPVRQLRETVEHVRAGDLAVRSAIRTGDEFEELASTFNGMLETIEDANAKLRASNAAMDLKVTELTEANVRLDEAMTLKSDFLASVSHELRTPLNAIIGFAELLLEIARTEHRERSVDPSLNKRIRYLDNIVVAGRSLLTLIEDLLAMARLEAGNVRVDIDEVSLPDVCEGLVGLIHPLASRKGVSVSLDLEESLPAIRTDARKFQQIVFNFLSNAVKFTEPLSAAGTPGRVVLRAERVPEEAKVCISVVDNGPGIGTEHHATIFEKFQQLENAHTRVHAGAGLGLAISKELASLIRGELRVVSEPGRGSIFSLIVPVDPELRELEEAQLESRFKAALHGRAEL